MKKSIKIWFVAGLAAAMFGVCAPASAQLLSDTNDAVLGNYDIGYTTAGQQFTTGSSSATIDSVAVLSYFNSGTPEDFTVGIYSDASGVPGSLLSNGALTGPTTLETETTDIYDATGLTLSPNTAYWVVFSNPAGAANYVEVKNTSSTTFTSTAGWVFGQTAVSTSGLSGPWNLDSNLNALIAINGTAAVPEPSVLALAGLGGFGLMFFRRKK